MIAYYLSGKLGLYLAIPPGFASAVWPASGTALACILMLNTSSAAAGVMAGSFALNLGLTSLGYSDISWQAIQPAMMIAFGALLQGLIGSYLFKQMLGYPSLIDSPKDIARFSLVVAPIGCLAGASIGVTTLYLNGFITETNIIFSWMTWWTGDTIGVLLFTPSLLMVFSRQQYLVKFRKLQTVVPTLLIFSGVLVLFFSSTESRHKIISTEISDNSNHFFQTIDERLNISNSKLGAYSAFYYGSNYVSQDEFNKFSKIILNDDTVFQAVGWTEIVPANKRIHYESLIRGNGFPDFTFTEIQVDGSVKPALERDEYYPVLYIYPLEKNMRAFGLNLAANRERLQALIKSRELAQPFATAPISLAQESGSQYAYIIYVPIFDEDIHDRAHFKGYISGVFRTNGLFGDIIESANRLDYGIRITDITDENKPLELVSTDQLPLDTFLPVRHIFDFGGRKIEAMMFANTNFQIASKDWTSWAILTGGFFVVALLQGFILIITGNTENTKREINRKTRDLLEAKKVAEDANKAKSNFTANMSHEIRTPLNAIIGLVNLCLKTPLTNLQNDYLKKTKLASSTLLSLINQVLDYSKIESGELEIENVDFYFPEILKKIHAIFSTQASQKNIDFKLQLPNTIPDTLKGDSLRLEQILLNLCSNAFKFTSNGSIEVILNIEIENNTHARLDFTIADTGIGIPEEQQQFLFESYKQADSSTSRKFGGSGLGLTISKQLVELMSGSIHMSSEENVGSKFYIHLTLPLTPETKFIDSANFIASINTSEAEDTDNSDQQLAPDIAVDNRLNNICILLAEDVVVNQLIAQAVLQGQGATVIIANNGVEALKQVDVTNNIDLVLMDIQMPEMDGYTATKKIRENPRFKDLPIIAMTANAMSSDIEQCIAAGMNEHVAKPFVEDELITKILAQLSITSHKG